MSLRPEALIQSELKEFLKKKGWWVKVVHGNMFQSGLPDLYAAHRKLGTRWIEVKHLKAYHFTRAQLECFQQMTLAGVGVWILTAATEEEYAKLFKPANWYQYLSSMGNSNGQRPPK